MKTNKITDYLTNEKVFLELVNKIYEITSFLNKSYPNYEKWFYEKQVKGCLNGERNIIFITNDDEIIGIISVKKANEEKKICTLFVKEEYRNKGIGSMLLEESFKFLDTNKPLITIGDNMLPIYEEFINKYKWNFTEKLYDFYVQGINEYCYNGKLEKNKSR